MPLIKVIVKLVKIKVVVWTSMAPKRCTKACRYLRSGLPSPVIILKRFVLKHCAVGASLSECGKEFHRWQPLFKKDHCPATRFMWDGNKPF